MDLLESYPFKTTPMEHQLKELRETWQRPYWAYFWEMGTGKSKPVIDNLGLLFLDGKVDTAIIIAKKGEYANWVYTQIPTHMSEAVPHETVLYSAYNMLLKSGKKKLEQLLKPNEVSVTKTRRLRTIIVNIEAMTSTKVKETLKQLYKTARGVFFIVDESTCAKTITSVRSKEVYGWAAKSHYRRIMTGSPVTNSPEDLWGQSLILGRGILGTTSFYSFRDMYTEREPTTIYRGGQPQQIMVNVGPRNLDRLVKYLDLFSSRLTKDKCLDLPPKVYSKVAVELTKEQHKLYTELRDQALLTYGDQQLEITHALTLITKLHQIACGQLKFEDGTYATIPNNRLQALEDILEDYPGKVIIWASYRQTLEDIVRKLSEKYGADTVLDYYGGTSDARRKFAIEQFQDPKAPGKYFVANPQSAGYGLTLTAANLVIYYSNSYNLEYRLQSEDRAHRMGQTQKVTYIDLFTPDTIDDRIIEILRAKKNLADIIMGQSLRDWL